MAPAPLTAIARGADVRRPVVTVIVRPFMSLSALFLVLLDSPVLSGDNELFTTALNQRAQTPAVSDTHALWAVVQSSWMTARGAIT